MEAEGKDKDFHKPMKSFALPPEMQMLSFFPKPMIFDKTILLC